MTLRMGDGPVANLPDGLDAYGGYVNRSGIGVTFPELVKRFPALAAAGRLLSFTTDGERAMCADVEKGAMTSWAGYDYGYCSVSRVNAMIRQFGRPRRLLTAHQDPKIGAHICSPKCWPGLLTTADGTQHTDHGGWDESLLSDGFFDSPAAPPAKKGAGMYFCKTATAWYQVFDSGMVVGIPDPGDGTALTALGPVLADPVDDAYIEALRSAWYRTTA